MKTILRLLLLLLIFILAYLLFWPVSIQPYSWQPPAAPALTGIFTPNERLKSVHHQPCLLGTGPEDIAQDSLGNLYGGLQNGVIFKYVPGSETPVVFTNTGGRPLGLHVDRQQHLIVADANKGLLSIDPSGNIRVLATEHGGFPFRFTDDLDIGADGTIYFSDASHRFDQHHYRDELFEHGPNGRLLAYDPTSGTTSLLIDSLRFANGVAVSPDQSFVLINETGRYQILRYWLTGPLRGTADIFIDNLPGIPDGISAAVDGTFWVALFTLRNQALDRLLPQPFLRKIVFRLPQAIQPQAAPYSFVLGLDLNGKVIHNLQDPTGGYAPITSVQEENGILYFGSLSHPDFAWMPAP